MTLMFLVSVAFAESPTADDVPAPTVEAKKSVEEAEIFRLREEKILSLRKERIIRIYGKSLRLLQVELSHYFLAIVAESVRSVPN